MDIPAAMRWWESRPGGSEWLASLPGILERSVDAWGITLGPPFPDVRSSYVAPARLGDGSEAVFKVTFPDWESEHEAAGLAHWDGDGAVRLLANNHDDRAMLIERCRPGYSLLTIEDDAQATRIAAAMLRRLWRPAPTAHPFTLLADVSERWSRELPLEYAGVQAISPGVLAEGLYALEALGPSREPSVVLHQDLHGGNILAAERELWLVIDPKPLVGPCEFDAASLLRDRRLLLLGPDGPHLVRQRLDILAEELPVDREKMRLWGIAHALAWGLSSDGTPYQGHMRAAEILHALR